MALFLFNFFTLFHSSLLYYAMANDGQKVPATVEMNCKCNSVGYRVVNIIWEPLHQDADSLFEPSYYRVFHCKSSQACSSPGQGRHYQLGCTLNVTTRQTIQKKELSCSITSQTLFRSFYFFLEMTNSSGTFISTQKTCRLASNVQCAQPQQFRVTSRGKRNISLSWEPSKDMGTIGPFLCYRIWYQSTQSKINESLQIVSMGKTTVLHTFHGLNPYTEYTFFIQCSPPSCVYGWSKPTGPLKAVTKEEVPSRAPEFENWSASNIGDNKRNVILAWKLPPSDTWNGVLKKFRIIYTEVPLPQNDSSIPVSNSSKILEINNGSVKRATLSGLNRFANYQTVISTCTSPGCGPNSSPWLLTADVRDQEKNTAQKTSSSSPPIVGIIIGVVATVVIIVIISLVFFATYNYIRQRRRRENLPPLDNILQLDSVPLYDVAEDSSPSSQNSYAEIRHDCDGRNILHDGFQAEQDAGVLDT